MENGVAAKKGWLFDEAAVIDDDDPGVKVEEFPPKLKMDCTWRILRPGMSLSLEWTGRGRTLDKACDKPTMTVSGPRESSHHWLVIIPPWDLTDQVHRHLASTILSSSSSSSSLGCKSSAAYRCERDVSCQQHVPVNASSVVQKRRQSDIILFLDNHTNKPWTATTA